MRRKEGKPSSNDLTTDEIAMLRSTANPVVRQYLNRQHEDVGLKVSAYRKVADAARAERSALLEVHALNVVRQKLGDSTLVVQSADLDALERQNDELRGKVQALTAGPAMAVHSDD